MTMVSEAEKCQLYFGNSNLQAATTTKPASVTYAHGFDWCAG